MILDDPFEKLDRMFQLAVERIGEGNTGACDDPIRLPFQHAPVRRSRSLRVTFLIRKLAEIEPGFRMLGAQGERLLEGSPGLIPALHPHQRDSAAVVRLREIRFERDRLVERCDGVGKASRMDECEAEVRLRHRVCGHQRDRAVEPRDRRPDIATRKRQGAAVDQDRRVAIVPRQQPRVDRFGVVEPTALLKLDGARDRAQHGAFAAFVVCGFGRHAGEKIQDQGDGSKADADWPTAAMSVR